MSKNTKNNIFKTIGLFVKKYLTFFLVLFIFAFLFVCDNVFHGQGIISDLRSISTSFTPTTDLFDDGSEVSFVSYFFGMSRMTSSDEKAVFSYPSYEPNISSSDDFLTYSYDGIIFSVGRGIVCSIGYTTGGEKYIEIEHSEGYKSRYVGFSTFGVATGDRVNMSSPIASCRSDEIYKVYIHKDGNLVKISDIAWEN